MATLPAMGNAAHRPGPTPGLALNVLAFDTATETLALALHAGRRHAPPQPVAVGPGASPANLGEGAGTDFALDLPGGAAASATLLPQARALLASAGLSWCDLDAVAFGRGPGAFTGLRTSAAVAQGLAFGIGCPVLPIDSLLIVAEAARAAAGVPDDEAFDVAVAMDARMDEVYAARWCWQPAAFTATLTGTGTGTWQLLMAPCLTPPEAWALTWQGTPEAPPPVWVTGSAPAVFGARLPLPAGARVLDATAGRAAALLRLARAAAAAGAGVDAAQALPLYVRDKVAQTSAERAAARVAEPAAARVNERGAERVGRRLSP